MLLTILWTIFGVSLTIMWTKFGGMGHNNVVHVWGYVYDNTLGYVWFMFWAFFNKSMDMFLSLLGVPMTYVVV